MWAIEIMVGTMFLIVTDGVSLTFGEQMSLWKITRWYLCFRSLFKLRRNSSTIPKSPNSRKNHKRLPLSRFLSRC
jgi:hypothetical protein